MLIYEVHVSKILGSSDVVSRHLKTFVNGSEKGAVKLPRETVKIGGLAFHVGDNVRLELRDVDEAGNHSDPAIVDFVVHDTIAPAAPMGFGIKVVGERPDDGEHLAQVESHDRVDGKLGEGQPAKSLIAMEPELPSGEIVEGDRLRDTDGPEKFHGDETE